MQNEEIELRFAGIFTDRAVLQRGIPLPVWGWAPPGSEVSVAIAGRAATARAGDDGKWMVRLPALDAGGPHELTARCKGHSVTLSDILVGEVWLCSGQSNMEWSVVVAGHPEEETADADRWPQIRLLTPPKVSLAAPRNDLSGAAWEVCSRHTIPNFSAVAYSFGRCLQRELGVPVGLINSSWGGTVAETWANRESLLAEPELRPMVEAVEKDPEEKARLREVWQKAQAVYDNLTVNTPNSGWPQG